MKSITIQEFQADFDFIISQVEDGKSFLIRSDHGDAILIPYGDNKETDDLIRIHTDHEEGS